MWVEIFLLAALSARTGLPVFSSRMWIDQLAAPSAAAIIEFSARWSFDSR